MTLSLHPEVDPVWSHLTNEQRSEVSITVEFFNQYLRAENKSAALYILNKRFAPSLGYEITKPTIYRKIKAIEKGIVNGVCEGVLGIAAVRLAMGARRSPKLPPAFIAWLRGMCGDMQRRKFQPVFREIINKHLRTGAVIPGYGKDWRGIWADEHPGETIPQYCPYNAEIGKAACQPASWSYSNLKKYAPEKDVWAGAAVGVHAMRKFNMSIPHTRVGLRPMQVITMDDVDLDVMCHWAGGSEARRPVGLGVLDIATGCMIDFTLVQPKDDALTGKKAGLRAFWNRYAWANILCNIGIDMETGVTFLAEHGTAGLEDDDVERMNRILGPRPNGGCWLAVNRSSTSGAPILKGLFSERGRGLPNFKAPLESMWNLLHNELAMLPGQQGKDWANAPQDTVGWQREDRELICAAKAVKEICLEAVEELKYAQTHALSYHQLLGVVRNVINGINSRHGHGIQDFEKCGYVNHMVEVAGALVPLDKAAKDLAGALGKSADEMLRALAPQQRVTVMSPMEAWHKYDTVPRKVFSPFVATQILGDELSQVVTCVRGQFEAVNQWSDEKVVFAANVRTLDRGIYVVRPGEKLRVWVNPINDNWAMVSRPDGEFLGVAPQLMANPFGASAEEQRGNLAELAITRAEQQQRLSIALAGRLRREVNRRGKAVEALTRAAIAAGAAETPRFNGVDAADVMALTDTTVPPPSSAAGADAEEEGSFLERMNNV